MLSCLNSKGVFDDKNDNFSDYSEKDEFEETRGLDEQLLLVHGPEICGIRSRYVGFLSQCDRVNNYLGCFQIRY